MNCSIVIRAYNEGQHIGRLLDGVRQQTVKNLEVLLVDSGSTDETVSIAESYVQRLSASSRRTLPLGVRLTWGCKPPPATWS
jgi:rhamnosyltransferase